MSHGIPQPIVKARPNPFRVKVKLFSGCVRVEVTAMRVDIPVPESFGERAQTMVIVDAMREMTGMFGAALAIALKDCSHTIIAPGAEEKPASNVTPLKP